MPENVRKYRELLRLWWAVSRIDPACPQLAQLDAEMGAILDSATDDERTELIRSFWLGWEAEVNDALDS